MNACVVSFKECWQDDAGRWLSYGGFPLQMAGIARLFDAVTLVVVRGPAREGGIPLPPRARVVPLRRPIGSDGRRKLSIAARLPYYVAAIAREVRRADVVHIPLPGDIPFVGLLVALVLRKRVLARYGGSWVPNHEVTVMNRLTRAALRTVARGPHVVLATGEGVGAPAPGVEWVFSTALSQADLEAIRPDLDRGVAPTPRLVFAGRVAREKGLLVLVEGIAALRREGFAPMPEVLIIGDGPERAVVQKAVRAAGCADLFTFTGQLDRASLARELASADLCVQPSLSEGFSKAWLDAMAHGLPVITSAVGAAAAVIGGDGERGWLVPPGDAPALASAIRRALSSDLEWPALRRRCRRYVEDRTLESWAQLIGRRCAVRWDMCLADGRLHA